MKNKKIAKWSLVVGGLAVSALLIVLISREMSTPPVEDVPIPPIENQVTDVVTEKPEIPQREPDFEIPPIEIPEKEPETINGDDEGTEQTIQPDPVKPEPTEEQLTDKTQTPSGEKVDLPETQEEEIEQESQPEPTPPPVQPSNPSGGLPGFDNVPDAGPNEGTYVEDMIPNGNQVGIM